MTAALHHDELPRVLQERPRWICCPTPRSERTRRLLASTASQASTVQSVVGSEKKLEHAVRRDLAMCYTKPIQQEQVDVNVHISKRTSNLVLFCYDVIQNLSVRFHRKTPRQPMICSLCIQILSWKQLKSARRVQRHRPGRLPSYYASPIR